MTNTFDWQGRVGQNWAREHERTDRSFRWPDHGPRRPHRRSCPPARSRHRLRRWRNVDSHRPSVPGRRSRRHRSLGGAGHGRTPARCRIVQSSVRDRRCFALERRGLQARHADFAPRRHVLRSAGCRVRKSARLGCTGCAAGLFVLSAAIRKRLGDRNRRPDRAGRRILGSPTAPGPFAFADREPCRTDPAGCRLDRYRLCPRRLGLCCRRWATTPPAMLRTSFVASGRLRPAIAAIDGDAQKDLIDRLVALARRHLHDGQVSFACCCLGHHCNRTR